MHCKTSQSPVQVSDPNKHYNMTMPAVILIIVLYDSYAACGLTDNNNYWQMPPVHSSHALLIDNHLSLICFVSNGCSLFLN